MADKPKRGPWIRLPKWADEWLEGNCGCGARLVLVYCWGHTHDVCAKSGWEIGHCPDVKKEPA